ncbi:amidohydrolase [Vineibacter terrae]|uniref:Amidohydrolase n=1 Tax=Vineibacter terrae TaxID=2586908 RepID=A0A5C8P9G1_9HYPH|nr:amidohydrolase family protein [Vineibacter terrae]TXL70403.1 amidohydrolase [Vineibacter terrae]
MTTQAAPPRLGNVFPPNADWLAKWHEDALEPSLPIVDPHHHLWERPDHRYLMSDLLDDTGSGHNVTATVFVECMAMYQAGGPEALQPVGETEFVNGVAAMSASGGYGETRLCAGIVGFADLALGDRVAPVLEAHVRAGGGRFRGIRHAAGWDPSADIRNSHTNPPQGLLRDSGFRAGYARLAPLGLTFDAWLYHPQLDDLLDLARAFPGTTIILDHVGGPLGYGPYAGKTDETFARWTASMRALAGCPNVVVKLGGLGMRIGVFDFHKRDAPSPSQALAAAWKPWVDTCIEAFGADRCMFESNFPVDKITCSYAVLWNAFKRLAAAASASEKAALFSGTASRVYRL